MQRFVLIVGFVAVSVVNASQAIAGTTTVPVRMTFAEPIRPAERHGCPISPMNGLCGRGEVVPFGHATETVLFGGACSGECDARTISLANGSIYTDEVFSNPTCPGACRSRGHGHPESGTLTDVIVGGTGIFTGASGTLNGSVHGAGTAGVAKLSGTITLTS
jgi:hypothetical protein